MGIDPDQGQRWAEIQIQEAASVVRANERSRATTNQLRFAAGVSGVCLLVTAVVLVIFRWHDPATLKAAPAISTLGAALLGTAIRLAPKDAQRTTGDFAALPPSTDTKD